MATLFLMLIYLTFISLGLPDSLLGAVWPAMRLDLGAGLAWAGGLSMIVSGGTVVSSLASERMVERFGAGWVTAVSVFATAGALLGFGLAPSFWWLAVLAVPLGLGAGAVDAAVNNYVALHYEARHMAWLHSFWGVGTFTGPLVLAAFLRSDYGWRGGYLAVGCFQAAVSIVLFSSVRLWKRGGPDTGSASMSRDSIRRDLPKMPPFKIAGVKYALASFLLYSAVESSAGLWGGSYLAEARGYDTIWAARGSAAFFGGITVGRFLGGFLTAHFRGPRLIRYGIVTILAGAVVLALPLPGPAAFVGMLVVGLGCAPVFPSIIHETPRRFGSSNSQKVIGLQMATAYCGTTFLPPLLGMVASRTGLWIFPYALMLFAAVMLASSEAVTRAVKKDIAERARLGRRSDSDQPG